MFGYRVLGFGTDANVGGVEANWASYDATNDKTPVEFSSNGVLYVKTINIDSTRFLVAYSGASSYCRVRIGSVSTTGVVTFGTEAVVASEAIADCAIDLLDETHAIVAWESSSVVKCAAIEFSGTTVGTVGSAVTVQSINANTDMLEVAAITSSEFFVAYPQQSTTTNRCYYGSVSGTTVTMGSGINFVSATIQDMDICKLSDTTALISYGRSGLFDWSCVLITKSGTAPTVTDTHSINNGSFSYANRSIRRLSDTTAISLASENSGNTVRAVVLTNTSGTMSNGTIVTVESSIDTNYASLSLPNLTQAVATYTDSSLTVQKTTVITIDGTTLTPLTNYSNGAVTRRYMHTSEVGTNFVSACYRDEDDSGKGKCMVLTV